MKTYSLFYMPPCLDVGTQWYLHRFYTSEATSSLPEAAAWNRNDKSTYNFLSNE